MSGMLEENRNKVKKMNFELNILRLETRVLELDEEKIQLIKSIAEQKERLTKGEY